MCGIAGIVCLEAAAPPPELEELAAMAGALRHRGPDERGLYRDGRAGLAHTRLSIIDLATGQQPLEDGSGELWISFNGEIFNYLELREELLGLGYRFRTRSDTEVIVHAFAAWDEGCFERFNGQFAIALWDARRRRLTLARDRLGERPLHLCTHRGRLYFASEIKAIFAADPSIPRALDPAGLAEVFSLWTPVAPRTAFLGVSELEPGHVRTLELDGDRVRERTYWQTRFPVAGAPAGDGALAEFGGSLEQAQAAVGEALQRSVSLRLLRADVPVGCFLSGGLDSSLIAALGRRAKGARFQTFSLRFEDAEYDETRFQRLMAERLETEHHELVVSRRDIAEAFPEVVAHCERPLLRTGPAPMFLLSRLVREAGCKVVLTGEGADELFAGYDLFREGKVRRFWARQPESLLRPRLLERLYPYLARSPTAQRALAQQFFGRGLERFAEPGFAHRPRWHAAQALQRLFVPALCQAAAAADVVEGLLAGLPPEFGRWSPLAQDQYLERRTLLSGYLLSSQGERMLMAHSVEGRLPFLDPEVVALADSLPPEFKLRVLDEKHVLKRAARGLVAEEILARPKQPYRAPDALAFLGPDRPGWIDEVLGESAVAEAGVFEPRAVAGLWRKCRERAQQGQFSNGDNMAIVGALSTQLLVGHFIRGRAATGPVAITGFRTVVDRLGRGPS